MAASIRRVRALARRPSGETDLVSSTTVEDTKLVSSWLGDWLVRRVPREVVTLRLGRQRLVYLLGPEANALIFGHDEWFRVREAFAALEVVDGPTSVVLSDGEDHTRRRGLIRPALAPRRVDGYVEAMVASADEALQSVVAGEAFDAYAAFRGAIRRSTLRALFGPRPAARADEIGELMQPLLDLADRLPQTLTWHQRLRSPAWRRGLAARERLDVYLDMMIARERAREVDVSGEEPQTLLATLVHGRDGSGSGLSHQEVRDQAVTMIAAGYETTGSAMGWIVYLLGQHTQWQSRARQEVADVLGTRAPGPTDLRRLPLLGAIVTESLRLYPPAMISARYVTTAFDHRGHQVRAGDLLIYSPYATHRDPAVYDRPEEFDPQRWEGVRRPPHEFLPFGGGQHRCLGSGMATTELTVMLARLLARGPFTLTAPPRTSRGYAAMRPHPGVTITLDAEGDVEAVR